MIQVNDNFRKLPESYLFSEVASRIRNFRESNPDREVIRMDIGDVTRPLSPAVVSAMQKGVEEMGSSETFRGYGPEQGYPFLRDAISRFDYKERGITIEPSEIFISDGAKSDLGNLGDILGEGAVIAVADPSYPAYVDAAVIDGRGGCLADGVWDKLVYLSCREENGFMPEFPKVRPDVIILCYPNNPTGIGMSIRELQKWVDYARREGSLIIFDSAYEAYVSTPGIARSVYEAEGADEVAIEVRSFSKTAGFTGLRCGYTVVPHNLKGVFGDGSEASLNRLWNRRQCTKFNGASYIIQRGAEALYTPEGRAHIKESIGIYMANAGLIRDSLKNVGFRVAGGIDSPYVWATIPGETDSWKLFEKILYEGGISCTPGIGFGKSGNGYIRLTGFNTERNTIKAMERISAIFRR